MNCFIVLSFGNVKTGDVFRVMKMLFELILGVDVRVRELFCCEGGGTGGGGEGGTETGEQTEGWPTQLYPQETTHPMHPGSYLL